MTTKVDDQASGSTEPAFGNGWQQFSNLTGLNLHLYSLLAVFISLYRHGIRHSMV